MLYSHPHDTITINDNTKNTVDVVSNTGVVLFQPFFSEKGEDSKIIDFTEYETVKADYGTPDINIYGQAYYHVLNWLEGGGVVKGIRLTAKDAKRAHNILMLDLTVSDTDVLKEGSESEYYKQVTAKYSVEYFSDGIAENNIDVKTILKQHHTTIEKDGSSNITHIKVPVLFAVCSGKGAYGKEYRYRFSANTNKDKTYNYRNYNLDVLQTTTSTPTKVKNGTVSVSLYPKAVNKNGKSDYVGDAMERATTPIKVYAIEDSYYTITEVLLPIIQQQDATTIASQIDFLTFKDKNQKAYTYVKVAEDSIDVTEMTGFNLGLVGGDDGAFAVSNPDRDDAMGQRLKELFNGEIDSSINDRREHLPKVTLDANFPFEVKEKMMLWRNKRDDHELILDCGIEYQTANLKNYMEATLTPDNRGIAVYGNNVQVFDKYNGKYITVTPTYLFSIKLIEHFTNKGSNVPFAGIQIPLNDTILDGTVYPLISDDQTKSDFTDLRCNYIEKENGILNFATMVTSQLEYSELIYLNNMFVLYEIQEALRSLSAVFRYMRTDTDEDMSTINKLARDKVDPFKDYKCKAIEVTVYKDPDDTNNKSLKCECGVGFSDYNLNTNFVLNIDRY